MVEEKEVEIAVTDAGIELRMQMHSKVIGQGEGVDKENWKERQSKGIAKSKSEAATAAVHISLNCSLLEEAKNETKMKSF